MLASDVEAMRGEPTAHATGDLELDTRVYGGDGKYKAFVSPAWEIWGPNGGYMASIALRAAMAESDIKQPASIYCQFLRPARFDWLDVEVSVVQRGKRSESIRVSLAQAGKPVLEGLVRTAARGEGVVHETPGPNIAAPESFPLYDSAAHPESPVFRFWENIETRIVQPERYANPPTPGEPHLIEWYRFRPKPIFDNPVVDAMRVLLLIDTLGFPAAWTKHPVPTFRAPNLDVAAFFHAPTQHSEWLLCEQTSPIAQGGLVGTSARIYDYEGRLLGSGGAQLLCV